MLNLIKVAGECKHHLWKHRDHVLLPWQHRFACDPCFLGPADGCLGSRRPLSAPVNFALSARQPLAYECHHSYTYSTAVHGGLSERRLFFSKEENVKRPEGRPRRKEWMAAWQDVFTAVMVMNWPLMINLYLNATLVSPDIWARPPFQSTVVIQQQENMLITPRAAGRRSKSDTDNPIIPN